MSTIKKVLTIAGSDCSGGAGIQADIKTITVHKMYAMSAITALTAQNTLGVQNIFEVSPEFLGEQLDCIFEDIFPDAVKIGMVSNSAIIEKIAEKLLYYGAKNIVVDPVMVSTSGSRLMVTDSVAALTERLFPLAAVVTPNIPEAQALCGFDIFDESSILRAAEKISETAGGAVLIKGGHLENSAEDFLLNNGIVTRFFAERINNPNTHGTGCTLSSAIACNLADGLSIERSVENAKKYITGALNANLNLGKGSGPLEHTYNI